MEWRFFFALAIQSLMLWGMVLLVKFLGPEKRSSKLLELLSKILLTSVWITFFLILILKPFL